MNQTDLVILVVYFISIVYVVFQAIRSLEERTSISVKSISYDPESLKDFVDVKFPKIKGEDRYKFSAQPASVAVAIENKSLTAIVTVDWDKSLLINDSGSASRIIRVLVDTDPSKPQPPSTLTPKARLEEVLTTEKLLRPGANQKLTPQVPIVDVQKLEADQAQKPKNRKDKKEVANLQKLQAKYEGFMSMIQPLEFSIRLLLQVTNLTDGGKKDYWGFVESKFTVIRAPLIEYVPWNPKK